MSRPLVISVVGAESTGKTTLAQALALRLCQDGRDAAMVPEALRDFCLQAGRTPRRQEQAGIAGEQTRRIRQAAQRHAVVVADTTALMIAVYSDFIFGDASLYATAEGEHRALCDLTLLTALDLPWQADGLQRDGPHVREPVDRLLRQSMGRAAIAFAVVAGQGGQRMSQAWATVEHAAALASRPQGDARRASSWRWICEHCSDGDCERHWLPRRG